MARKTKSTAKKKNGKQDTETSEAAEAAAAPPQAEEGNEAQFGVLAQFVKDVSFENPNAPMSLQSAGENARLEVNVNVSAAKHADDLYEVNVMLEAKANSDAGTIYNIELVYGTLFRAANIPDEYTKPVLFVDAPTIMFPYLRRIVSDLTRDGGFQPLMLDPIDFGAMFQQNGDSADIRDLAAEAQQS